MDETMFKRLLFAGEDDENIEELVELGYFKKIDGTICKTNKCLADTDRFINSRKELLYEAIKKLGDADDIKKIMEMAGISDYVTFIFVSEELIQDGKLTKSQDEKWIVQ